jgi:hypothetical protein
MNLQQAKAKAKAKANGIKYNTFKARIKRGWSLEKASSARVRKPDAIRSGQRYGLWVVTSNRAISKRTATGSRKFHWCRCACGEERLVLASNLRFGTSKGCGCDKAQRFKVYASKFVMVDGKPMGMQEVAKEAGMHTSTLFRKLSDGWTIEQTMQWAREEKRKHHTLKENGKRITRTMLAAEAGICVTTITRRLKEGMDVTEIREWAARFNRRRGK